MDPQRTRKTLDIRREAKQCPNCGQRFSREARFCPFDGVKLDPASFDPLRDPLLGTTIDGRYEIVELLGEGGTGRVYKVRHTALGRLFAIKLLRRDLARDEELAARFIQEAKATASVRHPNVVEITDFGTLPDGVPFLVTELLIGRTLAEVIKEGGPVALERAARIAKQIARALGAAHEVGIVHRDLKPDNIFLVAEAKTGGQADDVRVVDFGAAKVVGASRTTRDGIIFGTPHYMSPEHASGQPVDHRADVYSLGVILYEMLTGRVPFEADTYMGVLTQHMFVKPVPPSEVLVAAGIAFAPHEAGELAHLERVTLICLSKKPEERYASMADLALAVDHGSPDVDPASRRRAVGERVRSPTEGQPPADVVLLPKHRVRWRWLVSGSIVAALLTGAWTWVSRRAAHENVRDHRNAAGTTNPRATQQPVSVPQGAFLEQDVIVTKPSLPPPPPAASVSAAGIIPTSPPPLAPRGTATPPRPGSERVRRPPPPSGIDDVGDPFASKR
jgi:eukaryotic-like serine/threonine-protein kinase